MISDAKSRLTEQLKIGLTHTHARMRVRRWAHLQDLARLGARRHDAALARSCVHAWWEASVGASRAENHQVRASGEAAMRDVR